MNDLIKIPKIVYKAAAGFIALVFISWVSWVTTGVLEAQKEGVKIETIQADVEYIRGKIDECYDTLMNHYAGKISAKKENPSYKVLPASDDPEEN